MNVSQKGIDLVKHFEGLRLEAYKDIVGVVTIGYGTTQYPNANRVKMGDTCTEVQAEKWLKFALDTAALMLYNNGIQIKQCQVDALCSFVYNLGSGNFLRSTLRKMIMANPDDPKIAEEFLKWNKAGGKEVAGLTRRRKAEAWLYFNDELKFE